MDCLIFMTTIVMAAAPAEARPRSIQEVLGLVEGAGKGLTSYQAKIEYALTQPLLDSRTVRTGAIYYQRSTGLSRLRVSLQTLQQDQDKPQACLEEFLFDGVWLTHIDYQVKSVTRRQMTEPNRPQDAFKLASREFPIIGFTDINELISQFDGRLIGPEPNDRIARPYQLEFISRPGSRYHQQYKRVVFTLEARSWLPSRVYAESVEGDIYDVSFIQPRVNQAIDPRVFEVRPPAHFGPPQVIPLEQAKKDVPLNGD